MKYFSNGPIVNLLFSCHIIVQAASASEQAGILALLRVRDAEIFFQIIVFFFSQQKENQVFYLILKLH